MPILIGIVLAIGAGLFAARTGLDRDRAFYPLVTIVVASYYALFAILGGGGRALALELLVGAVFVLAAVAGFKGSLWIVVAALAGHGAFDFVHTALITNPGLPPWWPGFCGAYDVVAAVFLAALILSGRARTHA